MKIQRSIRRREEGSVLVYALVTCLIIGITMAAYMDLAGYQHRAVVRTEAWNFAVPVAEAGVEEGMTQLHLHRTNMTANGWLVSSNGLTLSNNMSLTGVQYYRERSIDAGRYLVAVSGEMPPTIVSQAYTKSPINNNEIVRTVEVSMAGGALFARGLVAKGDISWVGTISSDSFDSADPAFSTGGRYDVSKRKDNGSVGSVSGRFNMGGGIIYGSAGIGPTGSFSTEGGVVGDASWVSGGNTGVQPGHFEDDLNLSFPDVSPPFSTGTTPSGGWVTNYSYFTNTTPATSIVYPLAYVGRITTNHPTTTIFPTGTTHPVLTNVTTATTGKGKKARTSYATNYTYYEFSYYTNWVTTNWSRNYYDMILDSGDYYVFSIPNPTRMLVRGNARLYVEDAIDMQGQSQITISTIGTLNLYCNGNATLAGNGVVNATADATRFAFWGTPDCKDIKLGGNAEFTGTIYAPQAYFQAGGGGNNRYDIVGSAIVGQAKLNGHFLFHFDEKLFNAGPRSSFVVTGWQEI